MIKVREDQIKIFWPLLKKMKGNGEKMNIFKVLNAIYIEKFGLTSGGRTGFAGVKAAS